METHFDLARLADPEVAAAQQAIRKCVHCGFCLATCPTYLLLGDERDSPRGRIYLMKDMLEKDRPADADTVRHIDRCLSCLACRTTCPSGVDYARLVDLGRAHVARTWRRPASERWLRRLIAWTVPHPGRFRLALIGAVLGRPFARLLPGRLKAMAALAPARLPSPAAVDRPGVHRPAGEPVMRVVLLAGCAQQVLTPEVNAATVRLLTRLGCEVVVAGGAGCCGALVHHMGDTGAARAAAIANLKAWRAAGEADAYVSNASGCGTALKDYGFLLQDDPDWAEVARAVSARARDVSEVLARLGVTGEGAGAGLTVAYHSACSLRHGQGIVDLPKDVLRDAGFTVVDVPEAHICCGSAGTYNLLQPTLAGRLRDRKVANIESTGADVVAAGNVGCMVQIAGGTALPVVHPVELVDWATGGPRPAALSRGA